MEDPYKSSGSNYTGGQAPGVSGVQPIFSGADQPATSGAQPQTSVGVQGSVANAQPIFSSASSTPASPIMKNQPISSGTGDIILNSGGKKSKKGLVIGVVVTLLLLAGVGGAAAYYLMSNRPKSPVVASSSIDKSLFYSYANDVLYGTESSAPITGELPNSEYAYHGKVYNGPDSDQEYFEQIYQKYQAFYNQIQKGATAEKTALAVVAGDYRHLLSFLKLNPSDERYSYDHVAELYLGDGQDAAQQEVDSLLGVLPDDNDYAARFKEMKTSEFTAAMEYLQRLENAGCIVRSVVNDSCRAQIDDTNEEGESLLVVLMAWDAEAYNFLNTCYARLGNDCWQIAHNLNGEDQ